MDTSPSSTNQPNEVSARLEQLLRDVQKNTSLIRTEVRREAQRVIFESDARNYLYEKLNPPVHIGARGTWACNFQVLSFIIDKILDPAVSNPNIVELGSGVSTAWIGLALKQNGNGRLHSVEHDATYQARTESILSEVGAEEFVQMHFAPMTNNYRHMNAIQDQWYALSWIQTMDSDIDLLFVDGPPSVFGEGIRTPAYPELFSKLANHAIVIIDDIQRDDERRTITYWQQHANENDAQLTHLCDVGESGVFEHQTRIHRPSISD